MNKKYLLILALALLSLGAIGSSHAASISYKVTEGADFFSGFSYQQYTYTVKDHVFSAGTDFTIDFSGGNYSVLDTAPNAPVAANSDWAVSWTPTSSSLPSDGQFTATALVDNASLAGVFTIRFLWPDGEPLPGPQSYVLDGINGITVAAVPIPAAFLLFGAGLLGLVGMTRRRGSSKLPC